MFELFVSHDGGETYDLELAADTLPELYGRLETVAASGVRYFLRGPGGPGAFGEYAVLRIWRSVMPPDVRDLFPMLPDVAQYVNHLLDSAALVRCDGCGRLYDSVAEGWDGTAEAPDGTVTVTGGRLCGKCVEGDYA